MSGLTTRIPELIAHRGNAAEYPENTLTSLRSALELGARHVEFDVQLSADRQPMLLNDSNLKRTAGVDRSALEMTWQELAEISVNEEARFERRFTDVGIPSLSQAVSLLESHPTATAFVELKRASLVHHGRAFCVGWMLTEYSNLSALKCEALAPDYVFCDHQLLTQASARLWRGPWRWAVYEVASPQLALELGARGVRLIQSMAVRTLLREFRSIKMRA